VRGGAWFAAGDSGPGRASGGTCAQERRRHHQRVDVRSPAALPADAEPDLRRKEHDDHLPNADRLQRARRGARCRRTTAAAAAAAFRRHVRLR